MAKIELTQLVEHFIKVMQDAQAPIKQFIFTPEGVVPARIDVLTTQAAVRTLAINHRNLDVFPMASIVFNHDDRDRYLCAHGMIDNKYEICAYGFLERLK